MNGQKIESSFDYVVIFGLAILAFTLVAVAAMPSWRGQFKSLFLSEKRQVLAQVTGHFAEGSEQVKIVKVLSKDQITLEVYSLDLEGSPNGVMAKLPLEDRRDASINLQGNVTNLALLDINKDGRFEIIAPTYDDQMLPHLNAIQYNSETKSFEKLVVPEGTL